MSEEKNIPLEKLLPPLVTLRHESEYEKVDDVAESMKQVGQLEPIIVAPYGDKYIVVNGWRRVQAARKIGLKSINAAVSPLQNEDEIRLATITSQIVHSKANPVKLAEAVTSLIDRIPLDKLISSTGLNERKIRLLKLISQLPENIKESLAKYKFTIKKIECILEYPSLISCNFYSDEVFSELSKMSARQIKNFLREKLKENRGRNSQTISLLEGESMVRGKAYPPPTMDKLIDKVSTLIVELLDTAVRYGVDPRKIEWDIASDILNVYVVRLKCPWCGRASDIERFQPE